MKQLLRAPSLTLALTALALSGCENFSKNTENPIPSRVEDEEAAKRGRKKPISKKKAAKINEFGFQVYWDVYVPNEVIKYVTMEGDQLYAFTVSQRLYQIDVHSGLVNWVYDVGRDLSFTEPGRRPITEFVYQKQGRYKELDEIYFIADEHLYALDKKNGSEFWVHPLNFTPSSPAQAGDQFVYIGTWSDRITAIRKDRPGIPGWTWATYGDITARPAFIRPTLFVSSHDGTMYTFEANSGKRRWNKPTYKKLRFDPIIYNGLLYLPSDDMNLYALGVTDGLLHYTYTAGAPITSTPVAVDKTIYFTAEGKGMHALKRKGLPLPSKGNPRKTMHELLWTRSGPDKMLCKGSSDVYVHEPGKRAGASIISRLDPENGSVKDQLKLNSVDFWVSNTFDPNDVVFRDRALRGGIIFCGYRNGWIVALKETATIPGAIDEMSLDK